LLTVEQKKKPGAGGGKWQGTEKSLHLVSSAEPGSGEAADSNPYTSQCPARRGIEECLCGAKH